MEEAKIEVKQEERQGPSPAVDSAGQTPSQAQEPQAEADRLRAEMEKLKKVVSSQSTEINKWRQRALDTEALRAQVAMLSEAFQEGLAGISEETREKLAKSNRELREAAEKREQAATAMNDIVEICREAGISPDSAELDKARSLFNEQKFSLAVREANLAALKYLRSKIPKPEDIEAERKRLEAQVKQQAAKTPVAPPPAGKDVDSMSPLEKIKEGLKRLSK